VTPRVPRSRAEPMSFGWGDSENRVAHAVSSAGIVATCARRLGQDRGARPGAGVPLTGLRAAVVGRARQATWRSRCRRHRAVLHASGAPPRGRALRRITGTNGKSTNTALIATSAPRPASTPALGGNIGTAILSLERPDRAVQW